MKRFFLLAVVAIWATNVGATTSTPDEATASQITQNQSNDNLDSLTIYDIQQIEVNSVRAKKHQPSPLRRIRASRSRSATMARIYPLFWPICPRW